MEHRARRFYSLEAGRGVAALLVVFRHVCVIAFEGPPHPWLLVPCPASLAVVYFFVLSGIVMGLAHPPAAASPRQAGVFLMRRVLRIYPLYWCVMAVDLWLWPSFYKPDQIWGWILLIPVTDPAGIWMMRDLLAPAWTLHWEMFFYVILAVCLALPWRRYILLAWVLAVLVIHPVFGLPSFSGWVQQAVLVTINPLSLFFLSGLAVAFVIRRQVLGLRAGYALLGAAGCALTYSGWLLHFGLFLPWTLPGYCLAGTSMGGLVAALMILESHGKLPVGRWCVTLGNLSYPVYISHWLFLELGFRFFSVTLAQHHIAYAIVLFSGSLMGGTAVAYLVDMPMQRVFKWLRPHRLLLQARHSEA